MISHFFTAPVLTFQGKRGSGSTTKYTGRGSQRQIFCVYCWKLGARNRSIIREIWKAAGTARGRVRLPCRSIIGKKDKLSDWHTVGYVLNAGMLPVKSDIGYATNSGSRRPAA